MILGIFIFVQLVEASSDIYIFDSLNYFSGKFRIKEKEEEDFFYFDLNANFNIMNGRMIKLQNNFEKISDREKLCFEGIYYIGTPSRTTLYSHALTLHDYYFYYVETFHTYYNKFGIGYHFSNFKFSFISNLAAEIKISKLQFLIKYKQSDINLYFGGVPDELIENITNKAHCNVYLKDNQNWSCLIDKINFNGTDYIQKEVAMFTFKCNEFGVPLRFIEFIRYNFPIMNNQCEFKDGKISKCSPNTFNNFTGIKFNINGNQLNFDNDIIQKKKTGSTLLLDNYDPGTKYWLFGRLFLEKYLTLFDYDSSTLTFFSNSIIKLSSNIPLFIIKDLYIANLSILTTGNMILLITFLMKYII